MSYAPLLIIGAGPAGLSLAHHYPGEKRILEREGEVGGLCRSFEIDGAIFDIGGHSFHTPHPSVEAFVSNLMTNQWTTQKRDARIYFDGEFIPYPFQRHFDRLANRSVVEDCLNGEPTGVVDATNLEDWIIARFGPGIARHFMLPYNRKLWARDLRRISCEWVSERIVNSSDKPQPDGARRKPLEADSRVAYPASGGFVEIFKAIATRSGPIEFNCDVARINLEKRVVESSDGRTWAWERLGTTMPLPLLLEMIDGAPRHLRERASQLEALALRVLMIVVANPLPDAPQRVYVCDPDVPPHKVAFNHTSSPELRRRPRHAVTCEISHSADKPLPDKASLETVTIDWLINSGLVPNRGDVVRIEHFDTEFGYPVYTHSRPAIMDEIRAWLEPNGIFTLGRFGGWNYANSDEFIRQGKELANRLARPIRGQQLNAL